ncbi:hypothetical protein WJX73_004982 [Symbiochloris irregularis]|uniref:Uncharacterized protein n=1 Tax=Symbiochloris irregularis TaxID=706552 RepID=A0AAW1NMJ5_9CHLO
MSSEGGSHKGFGNDIIPYFFYSDASATITVGRGFDFHRIIVFISSLGKWSYRTVAWLPVIHASSVAQPLTKSQSKVLRQTIMEAAVIKAIAPLKMASATAMQWRCSRLWWRHRSCARPRLNSISRHMACCTRPERLLCMPLHGLTTITAKETRMLAKCIVVPLSAKDTSAATAISGHLMALRDSHTHSAAALLELDQQRIRTQKLLVRRFKIATPKLFSMRCVVNTITELGNVELVGTEFGERSHKDVKAAVPFTNGNREDVLRQVIQQVDRCHEAGIRSLKVTPGGALGKSRGLLQRAVAAKAVVAPRKGGIRLHLPDEEGAAVEAVSAKDLNFLTPELVYLPRSLAFFLSQEDGAPGTVPDLAKLLFRSQVEAYPRVAIAAQLHRGNPEEGVSLCADPRKPRYANVAVSGSDETEWFAAVRLFFGVRKCNTNVWVPHALVRWYKDTGRKLPGADMVILQ